MDTKHAKRLALARRQRFALERALLVAGAELDKALKAWAEPEEITRLRGMTAKIGMALAIAESEYTAALRAASKLEPEHNVYQLSKYA